MTKRKTRNKTQTTAGKRADTQPVRGMARVVHLLAELGARELERREREAVKREQGKGDTTQE